jgi:hypothetical protein
MNAAHTKWRRIMATEFTGRVQVLNVARGITYIRLDIPVAEQPYQNYFELPQTHENYNALYSLVLASAINNYSLLVRTTADINPGERAEVEFMLVGW